MTSKSPFPAMQPFNLGIKPTDKGRKRTGKTEQDRKSGAIKQNRANVQARGDWSRDGGDFPFGTCNGKKSQVLRARPTNGRSKR